MSDTNKELLEVLGTSKLAEELLEFFYCPGVLPPVRGMGSNDFIPTSCSIPKPLPEAFSKQPKI